MANRKTESEVINEFFDKFAAVYVALGEPGVKLVTPLTMDRLSPTRQEWLDEAKEALGVLPKSDLETVLCASLAQWLEELRVSKTLTTGTPDGVIACANPMTRTLGFADHVRGQAFEISLFTLKRDWDNPSTEVLAYLTALGETPESFRKTMADPDGRALLVAGVLDNFFRGSYYDPTDVTTDPDAQILKDILQAEAHADRFPVVGDLGIERPLPGHGNYGLKKRD